MKLLPTALASLLLIGCASSDRSDVVKSDWTREQDGEGNVRFYRNGRSVMTYQHARVLKEGADPAYARSGFLHPLFTPSGVELSDSFPEDHPHHHGIWTAWSAVESNGLQPDFWNVGKRTGGVRVRNRPRLSLENGSVECDMESFAATAADEVTILHETWLISPVPGGRDAHRFDLEITYHNVTGHEVRLKSHHYGGLGLRGRPDWVHTRPEAARLSFLTSNGTTDRMKGDGERARWFYFGGPTPNGQAGFAVMHLSGGPEQHTRFNPKDPFVAFTPVKRAPIAVPADGRLTMRYRILLLDGPPDPTALEEEWRSAAR